MTLVPAGTGITSPLCYPETIFIIREDESVEQAIWYATLLTVTEHIVKLLEGGVMVAG